MNISEGEYSYPCSITGCLLRNPQMPLKDGDCDKAKILKCFKSSDLRAAE